MNSVYRSLLHALLFSAVLLAPRAWADDDTMIVLDEGATPDDVVKVIALPTLPPRSRGEHGQATAESAIGRGQAFGQSIAEEAKNKNVGESIRDEMQQKARGRPER